MPLSLPVLVEVEGEDELRLARQTPDRFREGVAVAVGEDVLGVVVEDPASQHSCFGEAEEAVEALPLGFRRTHRAIGSEVRPRANCGGAETSRSPSAR